jgi:AcrR family transcriptional regulator
VAAAAARPRQESTAERAARIVDATLDLADEVGWEQVRLRVVAERLGLSLREINAHFRDLDAVADAWFARAWTAMLDPIDDPLLQQPPRQRLELILSRWFDALAPRRRVTVQILRDKAWPFHPHHWVPMIFNLSRTIVWLRDAAALDAAGFRRAVEEVGLTWIFLITLAVWSQDETAEQTQARDTLRRLLDSADQAVTVLFGRPHPLAG